MRGDNLRTYAARMAEECTSDQRSGGARDRFPFGSYRRRTRLVATTSKSVEAGMEDDLHYFIVRLEHDGERVRQVTASAVRQPWSTCHEAADPLHALEGMELSPSCLAVGARADATHHCTHMFDLAGLAIAHAWRVREGGTPRRQYDVAMPYVPIGDAARQPRDLTLQRDGLPVLTFTVAGLKVVGPEPYGTADARGGFFRWAEATFPPDDAEAAVVLKRASLIGLSRGLDLDRYATLAEMPGVVPVCWSQQPERAPVAFRVKGMIRDHDPDPDGMLASGPA
jgi:hypothetical protein